MKTYIRPALYALLGLLGLVWSIALVCWYLFIVNPKPREVHDQPASVVNENTWFGIRMPDDARHGYVQVSGGRDRCLFMRFDAERDVIERWLSAVRRDDEWSEREVPVNDVPYYAPPWFTYESMTNGYCIERLDDAGLRRIVVEPESGRVLLWFVDA